MYKSPDVSSIREWTNISAVWQRHIFPLDAKVCSAELGTPPFRDGFAVGGRISPVIVGAVNFVATPINGQPCLLTATLEINEVPPPDGPPELGYVYDFQGNQVSEQKIMVTVHSFKLDGREAGPVYYHWMCLLEVGVAIQRL